MRKKEIFEAIMLVRRKFPNEKLNRVWEIFCYQYSVDYEDERAGKIFDKIVDGKFI